MIPSGQAQLRPSKPTAPSYHDGHDITPSGYVFKIADSGNELIQAFHLLYHEYLRAGYVAENSSRLLFTKYHLLPTTTVFLAFSEGEALSTATSVRDSGAFGLPMDDIFRIELDELRNQHRRILEISSLASDRNRFSRDRIRHFVTLVYAHSLFQDVDDICIMVNPRHVRLYMKLFGFEIFGEERHYARVNAPAVALRVAVREARCRFGKGDTLRVGPEELADAYAGQGISICDSLRNALDGNACGTCRLNPLDSKLARRFLADSASVLHALTPQCRNIIAHLYPDVCFDPA